MTGSIKDYTPNFEFIIPEFNISGWHDYLEENFRSIDALFYNLFGINNFKGQWKNSTIYNANDVVFIGEDTSYSGRLVKVLVQHTTASSGNFTEFFTANPSYYELFVDASSAQIFAQEAKDWAVKMDGPVENDLYSSKYYADIVNGLSTEITALYAIRSDIQNVNLISTEIVNVSNIKNSVQTVASMQSDINDVVAIKSDIEWIADNDTIVTNVSNNSTKITTVANNISSVNTTATNITDINTVASNQTNINTTATNISAINTNASNISDIQNAYSNAQSALNSKNLAQEWAISENIVDDTDYSAKYYANLAKSEAESIDINNIVHKSGDETITGSKTFNNDISLGGVAGSGQEGGQINFNAGESETNQNIFYLDRNDGQFRFFGKDTNGTMRVPLTVDVNNNTVSVVASDVEGSVVSTVAKTKSSNGYFKLGNGLLIQWGRYTTVSGTDEHTISFLTPFSSATSYTIVKNYQSNHSTDARDCEVSFYNMTATGATTYSPTGDTSQISWLAIGY